MKLLTLEDYESAGAIFWPKYWYVAKELGEGAKAEDILKIMESLATVVVAKRIETKGIGPFGFLKKENDGTDTATAEESNDS